MVPIHCLPARHSVSRVVFGWLDHPMIPEDGTAANLRSVRGRWVKCEVVTIIGTWAVTNVLSELFYMCIILDTVATKSQTFLRAKLAIAIQTYATLNAEATLARLCNQCRCDEPRASALSIPRLFICLFIVSWVIRGNSTGSCSKKINWKWVSVYLRFPRFW